jgi:iron complex outermembrane recepter protein
MRKSTGMTTAGRRRLIVTASALALIAASPAHAQAPDTAPAAAADTGLSDIVVTASRREASAQKVPISITAVSGGQLAAQGITDSVALVRVVPNLYATNGFAEGNIRFAIRGLGSTDFSSAGGSPVGIYIDDVYQTYSFGIGSQIYDVDRVEVLRGPQGTLFGKNTTAGAVSYFSAAPKHKVEASLKLDGQWGFYGKYIAEAMFNTPLTDTLDARFDLRYSHRDDYVRNVFNNRKIGGNDNFSGRIQLKWQVSDATTATLKLFGQYDKGGAPIYHGGYIQNICAPANFDPLNTPYAHCNGTSLPATYEDPKRTSDEAPSFERYHNFGATLRLNSELGGGWNLTAISAYAKIDYELLTNDDGNDTDFSHTYQPLLGWQASQEVRLATPAERPVSAILGLFGQYDHSRTNQYNVSTLEGAALDYLFKYDGRQGTTTLAAFSSATWKVTERLSLVGGLRYSNERRRIDLNGIQVFGYDLSEQDARLDPARPPAYLNGFYALYGQHESNSWKRLTWDATANYAITPRIMIYGKVAQGFRSGGYNLTATSADTLSRVDPEILTSYEGGFKSELFDRMLRLNASLFLYRLRNQQILSSISGNGAVTSLTNAGRSRLEGFEIEAEARPAPDLRLNTSLGYVRSRFLTYDTALAGVPVSLAGNMLPYSPKWTATGGATYSIPMASGHGIDLHTDWSYRSQVYFDPYNFGYTGSPGLVLGNFRLTLTSPKTGPQWHLSAYVDNVTNRRYYGFGYFGGTAYYSRVGSVAKIGGSHR